MPYLARSGSSVTLTTPYSNYLANIGNANVPGPGRVIIYSIHYGANLVSTTTGIRIRVLDDSATDTYLMRHFPTPVLATGVAHNVLLDLKPGVVFDSRQAATATAPGSYLISVTITGTAVTNPSLEVSYDFVY